MAIADLDGDHHLDLAASNLGSDTVSILLGNGDGTFRPAPTPSVATGSGPRAVAIGDFEDDSNLDLAVTNNGDSTVSVYAGNGTSAFAAPFVFPSQGAAPYALVSSPDLGGLDSTGFVLTTKGSASITVAIGNDVGAFGAGSQAVDAMPVSIAIGFVRADQVPDIVTANSGSNTVSVILRDGVIYDTAVSYATGNAPSAIALADLDGDGDVDLAVTNEGDATLGVLRNNGDGTFAAMTTSPTGNSPYSLVVADFDGDGAQDLVVVNKDDNTISLLINNGDATFAAQRTFSTGSAPYFVASGDLNGDGHPDLVVADALDNNLEVLLATCP